MEIEFREFPADSEAETPYIDIKTFEKFSVKFLIKFLTFWC